ncbi:asparagine synthase (glutamine-hydrolyzing) [Roseospira navarrensis]|uniref:asparagine synthase (glutamine-hydrolyzing) n=1 Tax=Roseospira navarrensis TaxID=140058 RepID=A0A7X1ZD55_9PROT|nr:asparagine synthase (glutamine-hydrolyzing) [Roseospira navarrensis]MQX36371.1 asparagine synthase (glutamine-hydrolyzing) [Roseospira navarrensis]
MCGIFGAIGPGTAGLSDDALATALAAIAHRGPDAGQVQRLDGLVLGHRRLAIIDLDPRANQPMTRGPATIVFNGEVYNFRALRRELEALGETFVTTSDTEVLLAGYLRHGMAFLDRIEGMFAFALWDAARRELHLARDRFGEKPLFLLQEADRVAFGSEVSAVTPLAGAPLAEDPQAIGLYFRFAYIPAPFAPYRTMTQLEPGERVVVRADDLRMERQRWYRPRAAAFPDGPPDYDTAVAHLRRALTDAVALRMAAADVPVATLVSGGIDSSVLTVLADRVARQPVSAYSLGFPEDPDFDETDAARAVTARLHNVRHQVIPAKVEDILAFSDTVFGRLSEPFADASLLPTAYLFSHIDEKVVLSGDGADEVFGGYGAYAAMTASRRIPAMLKRMLLALPAPGNPTAIRQPHLRALALTREKMATDPLAEYLNWRTYAAPGTLGRFGLDLSAEADLGARFSAVSDGGLRAIQLADIDFNLPNDMLKKIDYASMFHSIEGRLPYLDRPLVEWALGLPDGYRINGRVRKRLLRDAFRNDLPPITLSRRKMGFLLPLRTWFRGGPLRDAFEALVDRQTRFDPQPIHAALRDHASGARDESVLLWAVYVYLRWRETPATGGAGR